MWDWLNMLQSGSPSFNYGEMFGPTAPGQAEMYGPGMAEFTGANLPYTDEVPAMSPSSALGLMGLASGGQPQGSPQQMPSAPRAFGAQNQGTNMEGLSPYARMMNVPAMMQAKPQGRMQRRKTGIFGV